VGYGSLTRGEIWIWQILCTRAQQQRRWCLVLGLLDFLILYIVDGRLTLGSI
jgi:hypothetical protein